MTHPVDRFRAALLVLAGHGHIKQRLTKCFEEHLNNIDEDDLPIALKQTFADLRQNMQNVAPLNGESAVCASVRKMSPEDASDCAGEIVTMFSELCRLRDDGQTSLPLGEDQPVRVPPFLIKSV
jgi:flagellar motor switch protein FliG